MRDLRKLRSKYQLQLDNRQVVLILVAELVVLALVFSLGVAVGKRMWQLGVDAKERKAPLEIAADAGDTPDPLSLSAVFSEELEQQATPGEIFDLPEPSMEGDVQEPTETPLPAPEGLTPTPSPEDLATAVESEPTPSVDTVDVGQLPGPPSDSAFWTVQVGSHPTQAEALELYRRLIGKGLQVFVEEAYVSGSTWYRVIVGRFDTKAGAEAMSSALRERENIDTWVRFVP